METLDVLDNADLPPPLVSPRLVGVVDVAGVAAKGLQATVFPRFSRAWPASKCSGTVLSALWPVSES